MTHRERHTSEEAPARDATATERRDAGPTDRQDSGPPTDLWTDWYQRASAAQQQEALLRAMHQGVVYAHQLAAPAHTNAPLRSVLSNLLNGRIKEMMPLYPPALEYHDGELDPAQREAVARAVATPDVCLIQGLPGTGKSRLLAEIVVQAAQRGERILLLAPTSAALDSVLERLSRQPAVCPIRCLAADESPANLPAASARLTMPERLRAYRETTVPAARAVRQAASQTLEARSREQAHWPTLQELAEQYEHLADHLRILNERRDGVAADVERSVGWADGGGPPPEAVENIDGRLAGLQAELDTIAGKQAQLDSEWETIRPLAEARRGRRLWTGVWWRALLRSGLKEQANDLEARRGELSAARQRLEQELAARRSERGEIENRYAAERRRLQDEEIARRRGDLDKEIAAAAREQNTLHEQWRTVCAALPDEVIPAEISLQAVTASHAAWEQLREQAAQRASAAEQWLQTVEEGVQTLPEKLAACANVVAATLTALPGDSGEGDSRLPPVFDLLILEQADRVSEPELAAAARRARRWVLIGEPQHIAPGLPGARFSPGKPGAMCFFHRLWQHLHVDPCRLPFAWMHCDGRLLCRLRPLAAGQEKWIETEPVVDRPDIELRILSIPRQAPRIIEVLFPARMGIDEAKQFIFHELEELAVQSCGRGLCWSETAEQAIVEFARSSGETMTVALEGGICERLARFSADGGMDWHTCAVEFSRAAGWTRQRAEEWIAERLGLRSLGRTLLLTASYRLDPALPTSASSRPTCQKNKTTDSTDKNTRENKMKRARGHRC